MRRNPKKVEIYLFKTWLAKKDRRKSMTKTTIRGNYGGLRDQKNVCFARKIYLFRIKSGKFWLDTLATGDE